MNLDEVVGGLRRLLERRRLQHITGLIGESDAMREVMVQVEQMAPVSSTVLIEGESGTGKELVARAIKMLSPRRNKPFIAENVGALPETLLESELFGHEKGAFTGAAERRLGRFELADSGTLFLDEIGEVPVSTQVKLLRVLEEREFMRVGGVQPIQVDVRVIAATNQPLRELVDEGRFRADLFYRLNVLRIYLPPLRERREDIPLLVRRFIQDYSAQHDRPFHGISAEAMQLLTEYPWPGNVRELRNLVESMVVLSPGHEIQPGDLPRQIREGGSGAAPAGARRPDRARPGRRVRAASSSSSSAACSSSSFRSKSCGGAWTTTAPPRQRRLDRRRPARGGDQRRRRAGDRAARSGAAAERGDHRARHEDGGDRALGDRGRAQGDARQPPQGRRDARDR